MKLLLENTIYEIQASQKFYTFNVLSKTHISFYGSPHEHPHDPETIILIVHPLNAFSSYYKFRIKDISCITKKFPALLARKEKPSPWLEFGCAGEDVLPYRVEGIAAGHRLKMQRNRADMKGAIRCR